MALSSVKPEGLPSSNDLDKIHLPSWRTEIRLGQNTLLAVDDPPQLSETIEVVLRLRAVRKGTEQLAPDSDVTGFCAMKIVTAWKNGEPVPAEQPSMIDPDGNPITDDGSW